MQTEPAMLKRMYADLTLEHEALQEFIGKALKSALNAKQRLVARRQTLKCSLGNWIALSDGAACRVVRCKG